jgi:DNA-binding transcriptional MocR family regulator
MDYMSYIRAIRSADLTAPQKITAIMIASHYDFTKGDPAFPSNKLLAKETGLGVSTVVKAKRVLSDRGYLCSKMQWDNSCLYTPLLPENRPSAPIEKLNTHINTHINTQVNTNINKNVSNETLDIKILTAEEIESLLSW